MKKTFAILIGLRFLTLACIPDGRAEPFRTGLNLGVSLTDGNSETLQANTSLITEGEKAGLGSLRAGIVGNYGESTVNDIGETTVENASGFTHLKKSVTERTFGSLNADIAYDNIARVSYRGALGPGFGVFLVCGDAATLSVEAGPSHVWEKVAGARDDYLTLRFSKRLDMAVSKTAKIWQALEYFPRADDFGDYRLNGEIGVEAAVNSRINLRLVPAEQV